MQRKVQNATSRNKRGSLNDSTSGRVFALHWAEPELISGIPCGFLSLQGISFEYRVIVTPEH